MITVKRVTRTAANAFLSSGSRAFGWRFSRDYLRFAARAARQWGSTSPGILRLLGLQIPYGNQSHALFLLHEIFVNGTYRFESADRRPRIVDCGANIGMSVGFFKALYPDADVLAVEADPHTFAQLERMVQLNGFHGVTLVNAAVGAVDGSATLYTDPPGTDSISASLDPTRGGRVPQQVPAVRLSTLLSEPVDFLKLDVEGAEYAVLRDLQETRTLPLIRELVVEYHERPEEGCMHRSLLQALTADGMRARVLEQHDDTQTGIIHAVRDRS